MDFNYLKRLSLFDDPAKQSPGQFGQYNPFDFKQAAQAQGQDTTDPTQTPDPLQSAPSARPGMSQFSKTYADLADEKGGPAYQKYTDFLNSQNPSRDDPKLQPGKMQKLSAMLVGMGEGEQHGGAAGVKSANSILDDKYNEAQQDYKLQGDKLGTAAGIEEKDMGRRVGILKDIIAQKHNDDVIAETRRNNDLRHTDAVDRNSKLGFTYQKNVDPTTGKSTVTRIGPDGKTTTFDIGIGGLTPGQKTAQAVDTATQTSKATMPDKIAVAKAGAEARGAQARQTAREKFDNIQELLQWKKDNGIGDKYKGIVNKDGQSIWVNTSDPSDFVISGKDFNKMSDADKQKAKIEYKAAPGPAPVGYKDTITRDRDGKELTRTRAYDGGKTEQIKALPDPAMEAFSTDGGATWKARPKK